MTEQEFEAYLDALDASMVIIDFFCLPDDLQDFELTDEMAGDIDFYEAMGRDLAESWGASGDSG